MDGGKASGVRAVRVEHFIAPLTHYHVGFIIQEATFLACFSSQRLILSSKGAVNGISFFQGR